MVVSRRLAGGRLVDPGHRVDQRPSIGVARIGQQFVGRAFFNHFAAIHHDGAGADPGDDAEIVADQHDGGAEIPVEFAQQFEDLRLNGHIERGGRFVGDQQRRLVAHAHRQHHALAHAARKLVRIAIDGALRCAHAHSAEQADRRAWLASFGSV